jgi:large subunit ribosomal protein L7/L12
MPKLTTQERLKKLEDQKAALAARIAREKAKQSAADRKRDTRRKIIVGAIVLERCERDANFKEMIDTLLDRHAIRDKDRETLGLAPKAEAARNGA